MCAIDIVATVHIYKSSHKAINCRVFTITRGNKNRWPAHLNPVTIQFYYQLEQFFVI